MAFIPPKTYPYGGGGLPRIKTFGGKRYYLYSWGPSKMPLYRLRRAKEIEGATSARQIKLGNMWVKYMR